jgi:hypothetical protein
MIAELGTYEMNNTMLDVGSDVNILLKMSWDFMGNTNMVWYPIQLNLSNQYRSYPIGILEQVEVNIDWVKNKVDFEVIETTDDLDPYLSLLGIE